MIKLQTDIRPRADGTVIAEIFPGTAYDLQNKAYQAEPASYIFTPDADGNMVCNVENSGHVVSLIFDTGNFYPYDTPESARWGFRKIRSRE